VSSVNHDVAGTVRQFVEAVDFCAVSRRDDIASRKLQRGLVGRQTKERWPRLCQSTADR